MAILAQFLLRLAFGLAFGMAITSARQVSSGYFRNHLYVTLGLATLAALALGARWHITLFAILAAVLSYIGSVCWLYEAKQAGKVFIKLVAGAAFLAAFLTAITQQDVHSLVRTSEVEIDGIEDSNTVQAVATATSGLLLGVSFAAMLLGHWYLNAPGMELAPLRRLISVAGVALVAQAIVSGTGLARELSTGGDLSLPWLLFVLLRWSFGLFGVAGLLWMAYQTLKIPNTQSATGILYVAVIGVFVGELTGLLLSAESAYPL
jgi:hypothetical protein